MTSFFASHEPDYHVPALDEDADTSTSYSGRCPRCGSRSILPAFSSPLNDIRLPNYMRVDVCASCGTRYRSADKRRSKPLKLYEIVVVLLILVGLLVLFFS